MRRGDGGAPLHGQGDGLVKRCVKICRKTESFGHAVMVVLLFAPPCVLSVQRKTSCQTINVPRELPSPR